MNSDENVWVVYTISKGGAVRIISGPFDTAHKAYGWLLMFRVPEGCRVRHACVAYVNRLIRDHAECVS